MNVLQTPISIAILDDGCVQTLYEPSLLLTEDRSDVIVLNPNQYFIDCIEVDGCIIVNGGKKCDWLLNINALKSSYLVELKGSDIDHAIHQLEVTHLRLASHLLKKTHWIISYSGAPRSTATVAELIREKREQKIRLRVEPSSYELTL